jgi:glycosyltransferase involved in cell wall biosynthesis
MATTYLQKKKLIFIWNNFLIGGTERILLDLLKNLDKNKFDISIVTILGSGPMEEDFKGLEFSVFFFGPKKYPSLAFLKILWFLSIPFIVLKLIIFFKKNNPDVIITSLYQADILGYLANLFFNKKMVSIQHDMVKKGSIIRWFKINAFKKSDKVIAISNDVKEFLIEYFEVTDSKIEVIYNGVDFEKFLSFQKTNDNWKPVFGIIARLDRIKGHIYILEAFKKLKNEGIKLPKCIFVGDGVERKNLEEFAIKNELSNVEFTGEILNIGEYLKQIDVFLFPSLSEGLGIAILEALVTKTLVIASNVGGIKELIKDKETGILVKPANTDDLYKAIKWVLENKEEAIKLREKSFEWINKNRQLFDIKEVAQKYSEIFNLDN